MNELATHSKSRACEFPHSIVNTRIHAVEMQ